MITKSLWQNDLMSSLKLVVELHVIQTVTLSFYGFKLIYPVFKIIDYPKNKLFMNVFCMRQIISPSCATDNQNPLELHVLWRFCICMFECLEWGNTIVHVVHIWFLTLPGIYKPCINFEWYGMYNVYSSCILNTPLPHS